MQLDRNIPGRGGRGKYALVKLRSIGADADSLHEAMGLLEGAGALDWGDANTESEFFVIRLKDRYAQEALRAYAQAARNDDPEWADEITALANQAGPASRWCKFPD